MIFQVLINQREVVVFLKKEDNKEYSLKDLITKVSKESDNVAHNLLGYYISNQSDATFKSKMSAIMGR